MGLFDRKPIAAADESGAGMRRTLGAGDLVMLAIGAVIGHERVRSEAVRVGEVDPAPSDLRTHLLAPQHTEAEAAVKQLQRSGFDMKALSIVGKSYHTDEHVVGYYNAGDRMMYWGSAGALWGGFWSLLFGSAFFAIPGRTRSNT